MLGAKVRERFEDGPLQALQMKRVQEVRAQVGDGRGEGTGGRFRRQEMRAQVGNGGGGDTGRKCRR